MGSVFFNHKLMLPANAESPKINSENDRSTKFDKKNFNLDNEKIFAKLKS